MSSYVQFSLTSRKARKPHRCIWCGHKITIGEKYLDERSLYDGNIQRHRWHPECSEASAESNEEFSAYDNERPSPEVKP